MNAPRLSVREMKESDIQNIVSYWADSDPEFLKGMGVDLSKVPARGELSNMLAEQLKQDYKEKQSYCTIWLYNGEAVGHSNINKIEFGEEAYMHLHLWKQNLRASGLGQTFIAQSMLLFFENCKLKRIYCEPYALNPAPNRTLQKAGFQFIKKYTTTPGWINFEQEVNLWLMSREKFNKLKR